MTSCDRKRGLTSIIDDLREQKIKTIDTSTMATESFQPFGDTTGTETSLESQSTSSKPSRRRRLDRTNNANNSITSNNNSSSNNNNNNNNGQMLDFSLSNNNNNNNNTVSNNNNNNHVKNERLSPGTPDNSSGSRSVTPSSVSHPGTPPAADNPMLSLQGRNYSDFMRSLAAKYNNASTNDYFTAVRNGFPPPLDPRFKPTTFPIIPNIPTTSKEDPSNSGNKKPDFSAILHPFATNSALLPPLIDMSATQALLAMMRTAKETELQGLLKTAKRQDSSSPLDLSAAAPPAKRARTKATSSGGGNGGTANHKRDQSESPRLQEDVSSWTVEDVCNFVSSIDICAEYAQNFRDQRIDGAGLPLLTEEHLTTTINMKLGPALKLKSILAKKLGSYSLCYLCSNCHNNASNSPENSANTATGNTSDSGGVS